MANNNAIRFLRGDSSKKSADITLLAGQPFYETNTNKLYVGDGKTALNKLSSITSNVENNINTLNNRVSNLDPYKYFWQGLFSKRLAVRVGDRSFITINECAFPALCVDTYESSGNINSVWQVSYIVEKKRVTINFSPYMGTN